MQADPVFNMIVPYLSSISHRPVILELGVHHAESTHALLSACRKPPVYFGWEPDPRNAAVCREGGVLVREAAVAESAGSTPMYLSGGITPGSADRVHTDSSSICRPTAHLQAHPWCKFDEQAEVKTERVDDVVPPHLNVDLMWVDVQGGQRGAFAGARNTLCRTKWLYCELHPQPMYEGEPANLGELLSLLPGKWVVAARYPADVLLIQATL